MSAEFFYKSYAKFSKRGRKTRLSVTPFGLIIIFVCIISGFAGINLMSSFLYRLFALSLSFLIISYFSRIKNFNNLNIKLFFPKQFPVGEISQYSVKIFNDNKKDIFDLTIVPVVEDVIPTLEQFLKYKEPNEDKRNFWDRKIYAYRWMWHIIRLFKAEFTAINIDFIKAGSVAISKPSFIPVRRGKVTISGAYLIKKDLFGIFNTSKLFQLDEKITVLPKRYEIDKKTVNMIKADIDRTKNSLYNILHKHKTGDFVGLRQYVPGDPVNNIHWKSWAKTQRPTVIEKGFGKVNEFNIALFNITKSEDEKFSLKFEDTLSFTYSLLEYFSKNWFTVNFYYFNNNELKTITVNNDKGNYPKLYEIICKLDYNINPEIEKLVNQLRKRLNKHSNSFFVLPEYDEKIFNFVDSFKPITALNSDDKMDRRRVIKIPEVNKNIEQITIT
ncbi:MAG: DUF58 domain-containing protein [Candidatus Delongbacteria bacterium]|jgi:uncharacterized protein (DUF58 family)|nr:DUF58 domain-containing protein [Candidatus Delongbacteria bacterium]